MANERRVHVTHKLDEMREDLTHQVTEALFSRIPILGVWAQEADKAMQHHKNMALTAQRFHDTVQAGATVDWALVSAEFAWADRKLTTMGITRDHRWTLIDTYVEEALKLHEWTPEEREEILQIASDVRGAVLKGYEDVLTVV